MIDIIPDLITCIIVLAFSLGYLIGNAGYNFDGEVKYGFGKAWYDRQNLFIRWVAGSILDVLHHFEYGLASIIIGYLYLSGNSQIFAWYFGWGFIISDFKDFENILIRLGLKEKPTEASPTIIVTTEKTPIEVKPIEG